MTRDFAKKTRSAPAKRKLPPRSNKAPGWVWLLTGTILGAFIMFLMHLAGMTTQPESKTRAIANSSNTGNVPKPRFDFYRMLKESEPESTYPVDPADAQQANQPTKEYILQAGSFRKQQDADRLRAQLLILNLDAYIEATNIKNGDIWHRVLTGPYLSRSRMAKARSILVSNEISPLVLTREKK
jgi:cell division protein FtsN